MVRGEGEAHLSTGKGLMERERGVSELVWELRGHGAWGEGRGLAVLLEGVGGVVFSI